MVDEIHILKAEIDGEDGLLVTFSDGTTGGYIAEELLSLRPIRETVKVPMDSFKRTIMVAQNKD